MANGTVVMDDNGIGIVENRILAGPLGTLKILKEMPSGTPVAMPELENEDQLEHPISTATLQSVTVQLNNVVVFTESGISVVRVYGRKKFGFDAQFIVEQNKNDIVVSTNEALKHEPNSPQHHTVKNARVRRVETDDLVYTPKGNDPVSVTVAFTFPD